MEDNNLDICTHKYIHSLMQTARFSASEVPEDDYRRMVDVLARVLLEISALAKCGANWDDIKVFNQPAGVACAFLPDKKTGSQFMLEIDATSIYLIFHLPHFQELQYMNDSFWELMLSLNKLGRMRYDLSVSLVGPASEKWERVLVRCRKSNVFSMLVDYVLLSKEEDDSEVGVPDITLMWPLTHGWQELLPRLVRTTEIGWRMNYLLYRSAHLRNRQATKSIVEKLRSGWK